MWPTAPTFVIRLYCLSATLNTCPFRPTLHKISTDCHSQLPVPAYLTWSLHLSSATSTAAPTPFRVHRFPFEPRQSQRLALRRLHLHLGNPKHDRLRDPSVIDAPSGNSHDKTLKHADPAHPSPVIVSPRSTSLCCFNLCPTHRTLATPLHHHYHPPHTPTAPKWHWPSTPASSSSSAR